MPALLALLSLVPLLASASPTPTAADALAPDATIGGATTTYTGTIATLSSTDSSVSEASLPGLYNGLNWTRIDVARFCDSDCIVYPYSFPIDAQLDQSALPADPPALSAVYKHSNVSSFSMRSFAAGCQSTQPSPFGGEGALPAACNIKVSAVIPGAPRGAPAYASHTFKYVPSVHTSYIGYPQAGMSLFNFSGVFGFENAKEVTFVATPANATYAKDLTAFIDNVAYVTRNRTV